MAPSVNRPTHLRLCVLTVVSAVLSISTVLAQQPKRLRVGGATQAAKLLQKVEAAYPAQAKQADIQGNVRLEAVIDTEGRVRDLRVLSGHPILSPAALDAVRQWRYEPTYVNREAIEVETVIEVNFQLSKPETETVGGAEVQALAFSLDGRILASWGVGQSVTLWEVATGRLLRRLSVEGDPVRTVGFAAEGRSVVAGTWRNVTVWDVETGRVLRTIVAEEEMSSVGFSPDGNWFAWGGVNRVELRDLNTGLLRRSFPDGVPKQPRARTTEFSGLADLYESVLHVEFSRDGGLLTASSPGAVKVWELESGREIRALSVRAIRGLNTEPFAQLNPNGRTLVSVGEDGAIKVRDLMTGRHLWQASGHGAKVTAFVFSPDGRWVASVGVDRTVKLWDADTGRPGRSLTGHSASVAAVAFSPDGQWVATGSFDKTIKLWEVDSGRELRTIRGDKSAN